MRIVQCDDTERDAWNAYVKASARASLYHRYEWREVNTECFGHRSAYFAAFEGNRIVGVFPIVQVKSLLFGNIACSLPFVNYGGPCGDSDEIENELIDAASRVADAWRVDYVEIRSRRHLGSQYPSSEHKVSMTLELDANPEKLWNGFKTGHRQDIRRGYKNGFTARFGGVELIGDLYAVLSESWRDIGTPMYSQRYLEKVHAVLGGASRICVVYDAAGQPAAGAFDGLHSGTVEGMWLGMRAAHRRQSVGYVLYWELIKHACENGQSRFHLGRSTVDSGAEQFKKKWNAVPTQLYWHYILRTCERVPELNVRNSRYQFAIKTWRKLPVAVSRHIGPMIARYIP